MSFLALCVSLNDIKGTFIEVNKVYSVKFINSMQVEVSYVGELPLNDGDGPFRTWASNFLFIEAAKKAVDALRYWKVNGHDVGFAKRAEEVVRVVGLQ